MKYNFFFKLYSIVLERKSYHPSKDTFESEKGAIKKIMLK